MLVGALILAAGAATRMGRIKQLLPYRGRTLIEHAIEQAEQAEFKPIVVVLGAQGLAISEVVARTQAHCVINQEWQSGMGSSITTGLSAILKIEPNLEVLAILLADQPFITAHHLKEMGRMFQEATAPILAASYSGTAGVPAFFGATLFATLRALPAESGARALLREGTVLRYELPEAATDIDTPEDFAAIQ